MSNGFPKFGQVTVATRAKTAKNSKIMPRKKLRHGVGSVCEVLLRNLHSRPVVAAKFPNALASQRLDGLVCIREEMKTVNHKQVMCFVFRHDLFDNDELHCLRRWSKVKREGNPEHFFAEDMLIEESSEQAGVGELEIPTLEGNQYDVARLQAEGYEIDDDNEPAPENAPTAAPSNTGGVSYGDWGFSGICQRRAENLGSESPRLRNISSEIVMSGLDMLTCQVS